MEKKEDEKVKGNLPYLQDNKNPADKDTSLSNKPKYTEKQTRVAKSFFEENKKEKTVIIVGDYAFFKKDMNYALNYARKDGRIKRSKELRVFEIKRDDLYSNK